MGSNIPTVNTVNDDARKDFLTALGITAVICVAVIIAFQFWGANPSISEGGRYALWGAFIALMLKMFISDWGNKKFEWHKHGYDMCIMTLGTSLTTLAYELSKDQLIRNRIVFLVLLFVGSMLATFLAGGNSRSIEASAKEEPPVKRPFLEWINIAVGLVAIGLNLYILVIKDAGSVKTTQPVPINSQPMAGMRQ